MKRMMLGALVAAVISFSSAAAVAQTKAPKAKPAPAAKVSKSGSCVEQRRHNPKADCVLEIDGDKVDGKVIGPNGEDITGAPTATLDVLIRIRQSMVDKMIKSSDRM